MKLDRRHLLRLSTLAVGGLTACDRGLSWLHRNVLEEALPTSVELPDGTQIDPDFHLLSRASFGPSLSDWQHLREIEREAWINQQLSPQDISDHACDLRAERFESLYFSPGDAFDFRKPVLREELTRHALLRAIYSRRQLFEVMVEFWTDHLNIDLEKGDCIYLKPSDDRDVIRRHALGNFQELIRASATSPAMLVYLDGKSNRIRSGTDDQPNENYARELLELHTLGVHGGYTQQDVIEAARCLSGWTFDSKRPFATNANAAFFESNWHDNGQKIVLGQVIPAGGGSQDIDRLIEIVCQHPSTARFIATKLCHRFVSLRPPLSLVESLAHRFTATKGDIKAVLRALFAAEEFQTSAGQLLKRPFKFMVSCLRALAADTHATKPILEPLSRMGHGLFQYPTPDGYPDEELPWMGTLMWRWNFALALASGQQPGARIDLAPIRRALGPPRDVSTWFRYLVGRRASPAELTALADATEESQFLGLILASPAFQRC